MPNNKHQNQCLALGMLASVVLCGSMLMTTKGALWLKPECFIRLKPLLENLCEVEPGRSAECNHTISVSSRRCPDSIFRLCCEIDIESLLIKDAGKCLEIEEKSKALALSIIIAGCVLIILSLVAVTVSLNALSREPRGARIFGLGYRYRGLDDHPHSVTNRTTEERRAESAAGIGLAELDL